MFNRIGTVIIRGFGEFSVFIVKIRSGITVGETLVRADLRLCADVQMHVHEGARTRRHDWSLIVSVGSSTCSRQPNRRVRSTAIGTPGRLSRRPRVGLRSVARRVRGGVAVGRRASARSVRRGRPEWVWAQRCSVGCADRHKGNRRPVVPRKESPH
ncbi:hypothetical protein [Kutzneria sp. CA-103260]|uniref:hypothetical protein n=1 Tax=Kutzneria sp. CA-103260 TaxID=2802641 RepID=UPI001BA789BE|nr:hypothetical protein [Kutzneria sp. CA-103260]